jgi:hypothetical protein
MARTPSTEVNLYARSAEGHFRRAFADRRTAPGTAPTNASELVLQIRQADHSPSLRRVHKEAHACTTVSAVVAERQARPSARAAAAIPYLITMLRAILVACWRSELAPVVTLFGPKMISSAMRPPMQTSMCANICMCHACICTRACTHAHTCMCTHPPTHATTHVRHACAPCMCAMAAYARMCMHS